MMKKSEPKTQKVTPTNTHSNIRSYNQKNQYLFLHSNNINAKTTKPSRKILFIYLLYSQ